jgi:transglutaminase-like putative cysteine protease
LARYIAIPCFLKFFIIFTKTQITQHMHLVFPTLRTTALWLFLSVFFAFSLQAQQEPEPPIKFGKLSDADRAFTKYEKDTDANAVVLCDFGKTRVFYDDQVGFYVQYTRHRRIKIFKKEGIEYANNQIILALGREKVLSLKAASYNLENGRWLETKMDKTSIFEEKYNEYNKQVKFTIPNVKEGSIIEYEYFLSKDSYQVKDWYFQGVLPRVYSEYRFQCPNYFGYTRISQGFTPYTINEHNTVRFAQTGMASIGKTNPLYDYNLEMYRWVQKDVPAFKDETYIASSENYLTKIEFQLAYYQFPGGIVEKFFTTWEDLVKKLGEDEKFGKRLKKSGAGEDLVKAITQNKTDPKERAQAIYDYVKSTYKWNGEYDCVAQQSLKDLMKSKTGSSADINLFLINLLKTNGLEAQPILISTRSNGILNPAYPILSKFDDVIATVKIGAEDILLDATNPVRPMNMLPYSALNGDGVLVNISEKTFKWVPLQNSFKATSYLNIETSIGSDNQLTADISNIERGYDALNAMKTIKDKNEESFFKETYKKLLANGKIIAQSTENNGTEVFKSKIKITTSDYIDVAGNLIYFNPMLNFGLENTPFKALERQYSIDFVYPKEEIYQFSLTIPKGYKATELPKSTRLAWKDGSLKFDYIVEATDQKIVIKSKTSLKNSIFTPDAYAQLRDFYGKMTAKHAEQIILTKIK